MRHNAKYGALITLLIFAIWFAPTASGQSKSRIAVIEFRNKTDNKWWNHDGADAAQDVFVTELTKIRKFSVNGA